MNKAKKSLTAAARRGAIQSLIQDAVAFWTGAGVGAERIHDARLCLEEMVTNIVAHGCGSDPEAEIGVELAVTQSALIMEIRDGGPPFDPTGHVSSEMEKQVDEREPGGMGIHLVRHLSQTMSYRRERRTNVLTLLLNR